MAEIETDKVPLKNVCHTYQIMTKLLFQTSIPCPSQVSGVIEELLFKDGDKVTAGAALYKVRVGKYAPFAI